MDGFNNENGNGIMPEDPQGNGTGPENINTPAEPDSNIPVQNSGDTYTEQPAENSGNAYTEQPVANNGNMYTEQPAANNGSMYTEQPAENNGNAYTEQPAQNSNDYYMPQEGNISSAFAQHHPEITLPPEKKKPIWPLVLALVGLLLLAGGIIAFIKRDTIANTWASMTMEPDEYFRHVAKKQLGGTEWFDEYEKSAKELSKIKDMKMEGEIRLNINDDLQTVMEGSFSEQYEKYRSRLGVYSNSSVDVDLSAYKDIALIWEMEHAGEVYSAMQALQIRNKDYLVSLEEMYDTDSSTAYFRIPQINEEYAGVNLSNFMKEDDIEELNNILDNGGKMQNALPSAKTVKGIYERYFDLMLAQIKDVEKETEQIEVNGHHSSLHLV